MGDETKLLKIDFLASGGGHIMMDKRYHGQAVFAQGEWRIYLADKSVLNNSDDIQVLVQILNEQHH